MKRERRKGLVSFEQLRERFEPYRPGGWWRRDIILEALELAYPHWLTAVQVQSICVMLRPSYRLSKSPLGGRNPTARSLGRLHSLRLVDRYGEKGYWTAGATGKPGVVTRGEGFRYRLIKDADSLL